jgi:hypothetical protein
VGGDGRADGRTDAADLTGTWDARLTRMKTARFIAAAALVAAPALGCTRESSRGPVRWTASNPSSAAGQTAAQAWSRSTSSDTRQPTSGTPAIAAPGPAGMLCEQPGVTNAQPPMATWPYDGVTLRLAPAPR